MRLFRLFTQNMEEHNMEGYVDIHSHILPFLDDGAKDLKTAVVLVKECINQGIKTIICTPHYLYSENNDVESFIKKRDESFALLKAELEKQNITDIDFRLGAEVSFNCDLSEIKDIEKLSIEGTDYILIEMPFSTWQDGMFDYLYTLIARKNLVPIIAHVERYYQNEREFKKLEKLDVYFQVNAAAFFDRADRKNANKLMKNKKIHLLGTDTHSISARPPKMEEGYTYIRKKYDSSYAEYIRNNGHLVIMNMEIEKNETDYGYHKPGFFKIFFRK